MRERIARGDTYQCNLTVRMRGHVDGDLLSLYRDLALGQRGAYNAYLDLGRFVIVSASPELFFSRSGDELLLRPMKGTARRGRDLAEDRRRAATLRTSTKERAENVMIVDLVRNDVARVADVGGVRVPALCRVERYETVFQLTSDVTARLRSGVGLGELFRALFPSGSVTGAPKASTMDLIRELETTPRGVYCGAIGIVGPPATPVPARFNVAIRTAVVDRDSGEAVYGVGGGITWGSNAEAEHAEVVAKTAVLHHRHEDFELLETMRYSPDLGRSAPGPAPTAPGGLRRVLGFPVRPVDDHGGTEHTAGRARAVARPAPPMSRRGRRHRRGGTCRPRRRAWSALRWTPRRSTCARCPCRLFHKTSLRAPYDRRRHRHGGVDEVIMINERAELTEGTRVNLAVRLEGRWWTPPLSSGCLPGVEVVPSFACPAAENGVEVAAGPTSESGHRS